MEKRQSPAQIASMSNQDFGFKQTFSNKRAEFFFTHRSTSLNSFEGRWQKHPL